MRHQLTVLIVLAAGLTYGQSQSREVAICKSTTLHLKAASPGATQYQWFRNDTAIGAATGTDLAVTDEGTYKAYALNAGGCISDESVHIVVHFHKPNAVNDHWDVQKNERVRINVLANDESQCAGLDSSTLIVKAQPAHGSLTVEAGALIFDPEKDFVGEDTFTYTVSDKSGMTSNIAAVSLDIFHSMPVTLAWFEAQRAESAAVLRWATSQEANSDHFDIERSADSHSWHVLGSVDAAFQSSAANMYGFTDSLPETGTNYYRLKMSDRDGTFAYSSIKPLFFPEMSWADLYPNPVNDVLSIAVRNQKVKRIRMINAAGTTMLSLPVTSSKLLIDMKNYALGAYMFHFEQEDGAVKVFRIFHN